MQRLAIALMALASLLISRPNVVSAQSPGHAVDPSSGQQSIDEPVDSTHPGIETAAQDNDPSIGTFTVASGHTVDSINVHARKLVIAGHITHDVTATESSVILEKGATVGGTLTVDDLSSVENHTNIKVHIKPHLSSMMTRAHIHTGKAVRIQTRDQHGARSQPDWFQSQCALFILGMIGAALSVVVTPNASRKVSEHLTANARRDLKVGLLVGLGLLGIVFANAILLKMPIIRYLWAPLGAMIAFAPLLLLGFGWLAGMRYTGEIVAVKLKRSPEGSMFSRMALGLCAFFVINTVLGFLSPTLGVLSLGCEVAIAIMGLGAAAVIAAGSGFGRRA